MIYQIIAQSLAENRTVFIAKDLLGNTAEFTLEQIQQRLPYDTFTNLVRQANGEIYVVNIASGDDYHPVVRHKGIELFSGEKLDIALNRAAVNCYEPRFLVKDLLDFVYAREPYSQNLVLALSGLRRTGKTTSLLQVIDQLIRDGIRKDEICYINILQTGLDAFDLYDLLDRVDSPFIFIDEITHLSNFIDSAAKLFTYAGVKRIVIAGTDSFTFPIALRSSLLGRSYLISTTFVSYREYKTLLREDRDYLRSGGVLTNELANGAKVYVDEMLAANITYTLRRNATQIAPYGYENLAQASGSSISYDLIYLLLSVTDTLGKKTKEIRVDNEQIIDIIERIYNLDCISVSYPLHRELMRALEELHVLQRIRNITPELEGFQRQTTAEYTCSVQALVSTLLNAVYDARSDRSEIHGKCIENLVLSECFEYFRGTDTTVGYFKYDYEGKPHEIDCVIRYAVDIDYEYTLIEIKHSNKPESRFAKHLTSDSLQQIEASIRHRYVVYLGNTQKIRDIQYIHLYDFLAHLDVYL